MSLPAQLLAARVTISVTGAPAFIIPCIRIQRGIDTASRLATNLNLKLVMKFFYESGGTIVRAESTQSVTATTVIQALDSTWVLVRGTAVTLTHPPDAGATLVSTVKLSILDSANVLIDFGDGHSITQKI